MSIVGEDTGTRYMLVSDWNYPEGCGAESEEALFINIEDALEQAKVVCEKERMNFFNKTSCDSLPTNKIFNENGFIITAKNGLDDWWYRVRIVEV